MLNNCNVSPLYLSDRRRRPGGENCATALCIEINMAGCPPDVISRLTQEILAAAGRVAERCEPYGALVDIRRKCVLLRIHPASQQQLDTLQAHIYDGSLVNAIMRCAKVDLDQLPGLKVSVPFSGEECEKLEQFLKKGTW